MVEGEEVRTWTCDHCGAPMKESPKHEAMLGSWIAKHYCSMSCLKLGVTGAPAYRDDIPQGASVL